MTHTLKVRVTDQMYQTIKDAAESRKMSISDFLRRAALGQPSIKHDPELISELVRLRGAVKKNAGLYKHLLNENYEYQDQTEQMLEQELNRSELITDTLEKLLLPTVKNDH